jgi:hypothetical protein
MEIFELKTTSGIRKRGEGEGEIAKLENDCSGAHPSTTSRVCGRKRRLRADGNAFAASQRRKAILMVSQSLKTGGAELNCDFVQNFGVAIQRRSLKPEAPLVKFDEQLCCVRRPGAGYGSRTGRRELRSWW